MKTIDRPKYNYLNESNWEGLYVLTNHWKSDLEFYIGEIRFLNKLIDKYFMWLINEESIASTETLLNQLKKLKGEGENILLALDKHLHQIAEEIKHPLVHNDKEFKEEHSELEERIANYLMAFRPLKKKIFDLVENVLEEEKIKHLMANSSPGT